MIPKLTSWQRLEAVINYAKMSTNAFAKSISLKRSENLYQIKRGNNGISKELADIITEKYTEINKLWLLTGEGCMFADSDNSFFPNGKNSVKHAIPYFDVDLMSVVESRITMKPNYYISMPLLGDCDFAVKFNGSAMSPIIAQGALVFLKKVTSHQILYNEIYLIVTESFAAIRYISSDENEQNNISLIPSNVAHQTMVIERSSIKELFIVKGTFHSFL